MEQQASALTIPDKAFIVKINAIKADMRKYYQNISKEATPRYAADGKPIIRRRDDGYDYVEEVYMRTKLDEHFPGWSWQQGQIQMLGSEWIIVGGHLYILDEHLLAFGLQPPYRIFYSTGAARIQFRQNQPHTAENVVDIDKNVASANTNAFKRGVNRLCRIADDIYGKQIENEGAGSMEDVMMQAGSSSPTAKALVMRYIEDHNILHSTAMQIVGVTSWKQVTDWIDALERLKAR